MLRTCLILALTASASLAKSPVVVERELSTDRPDKTESPMTVPKGRIQVETELATFLHDRHTGDPSVSRITGWGAGAANLKAGLTEWLDVQFVLPAWSEVTTRFRGGEKIRERGWSDLTIRAKANLWGNDGGRTALGVMPFLTLPTAGGPFGADGVEAGLIVPLSISLTEKTGLGMMVEADFHNGDGTDFGFIASATMSHDFTDKLGGYVEWFNEWVDAAWVSTLDVGLTYAITDDIQFDAGANLGLTRAADDLVVFTGLSFRF